MGFSETENFEEFMKQFGAAFDFQNSNTSEEGCNDINGGFQDLNPNIFPLTAELVGHIISSNLPFNIQNAIGNWFELLGQVILTYNAQQQYFQNGPGLYYNVKNKNIGNNYCNNNSNDNESSKNSGNKEKELAEMKQCINIMLKKIETLTNDINKLKNDC
ncbi:MAG: hypothetical protein RSD13_02165 [Clostridium sp.]|uniref:hypothetical protein n=1 Tax=Clostridium sp. TaxID=1506 RepID=UPI002FC7276A